MKVGIIGLRGIPDVQGGVERHVESLAPLLVAAGHEVTVYARAPYMADFSQASWRGVRICKVWSPQHKFTETLLHTFLAIWVAFFQRQQLVHIHAIGPSFFVPLARLLRMKVVMTHHGQDYARQKWGRAAKAFLRTAEYLGVKCASKVIVISHGLQDLVENVLKRPAHLIPNGVTSFITEGISPANVEQLGLPPYRYILHVSRFVPEKRHHDLIDAFNKAALPGWKLVFAGEADHADDYSRSVLERASDQVVFLGRQNVQQLTYLYAYCGIFVLPSSHEGLPIALLEALSLAAPVIVSDIAPHLELSLPKECYFPLGDTAQLAARLQQYAAEDLSVRWHESAHWVKQNYDWPAIAEKTSAVYLTA